MAKVVWQKKLTSTLEQKKWINFLVNWQILKTAAWVQEKIQTDQIKSNWSQISATIWYAHTWYCYHWLSRWSTVTFCKAKRKMQKIYPSKNWSFGHCQYLQKQWRGMQLSHYWFWNRKIQHADSTSCYLISPSFWKSTAVQLARSCNPIMSMHRNKILI